jgi:hypothetical protein
VKLRFTLAIDFAVRLADEIRLGARNVTKLSRDARTRAKKICDAGRDFDREIATVSACMSAAPTFVTVRPYGQTYAAHRSA